MIRGSDGRDILLPAFLSAALLILAQPPFTLQPLPFLALVPLALGLARLPPSPGGRRRAAAMGFLFGLAFWGFSLFWVLTEVAPTFTWAYLGFGVLMALLGGLSALFAWTTHRLARSGGVPLGLAFPLAWVGVEWIKAHFPFGLSFPWLGLGVTLTGRPDLLGLAEWTGEGGVAFWLAGVSGLVAQGILGLEGGKGRMSALRPARALPWILAAGLILLPSAAGVLRARTLALTPGPRVAIVGTRVSRSLRDDPSAWAEAALDQAKEALNTLGRPLSADLVLLPEATVPRPLEGRQAEANREELLALVRDVGRPFLVGALGRGGEGAESGAEDVTNSVFLLSTSGRLLQRYDKARLVPAMEVGRYQRGEGGEVLAAGGWRVGPLLCYESLFGGLARKARGRGADLLVNLSSDIWFGEGTAGMESFFLRQHPAHLVLRAVENRMPVARAANGGYSLLLDPLGRQVGSGLSPQGGILVGVLPVGEGTTLFTRTGDLAGPGSLLFSLLLLAWVGWRGRLELE